MAKSIVEVPSMAEVERAICDLQASDWIPRLMDLIGYPNPFSLLSSSVESRVCNVFQLMKEGPILRMVVSIATDKAVWNAIMANKEVSSLRNSFSRFLSTGKGKEKANGQGKANVKERDLGMLIIEWVLSIGNDIICDFIARFNSFLDKTFFFSNNKPQQQQQQQQQQHAPSSSEEHTLRFTYFLSGVVFLLVVVARAMGL
ncbi:uncharacterized protein LOC124942365 [Impatiens glandulifera]|uniref:uncharacterized protein LOC124942365 n=1 Tax=Impatiens glandulifera TaxID=253017 RepID=UPI001FB0BA75|nr:uncharacterized protein LOC124942365 [Impatiens glandulifera]XP_047338809.1 uncharacterized protein LOC124942365 [Impatiens glandulifera]